MKFFCQVLIFFVLFPQELIYTLGCVEKAALSSTVLATASLGAFAFWHRYELLRWTVRKNHETTMKILLHGGVSPNEKSKDGQYPLHDAVEGDRAKIVRGLLQFGADHRARAPVNFGDHHLAKESHTPLYCAAYCKKAKSAAVLRGEGPASDIVDGEKKLLSAAFGGQLRFVEFFLMAGIDPNCQSDIGKTPFVYAALENHKEVVDCLVKYGADANKIGEYTDYEMKCRCSALHHAASRGNLDQMRLLLKYGSDLNCRDDFGNTPLLAAVKSDQFESVDFLLDNKADLYASDREGTNFTQYIQVEEVGQHFLQCVGRGPFKRTITSVLRWAKRKDTPMLDICKKAVMRDTINCSICLENLSKKTMVLLRPCGHSVCRTCEKELRRGNKRCPICRIEFE